nr:uncharacterized protein LOC123766597 isoform X1 [Procambarus clarkii]
MVDTGGTTDDKMSDCFRQVDTPRVIAEPKCSVIRNVGRPDGDRAKAIFGVQAALLELGVSLVEAHAAAEKILKAALYLEDRNKAETFQRGGTSHSLTIISLSLQSNDSNRLASALESRVGHHTNMRYPSFQGCPCDYYTTDDANYMLSTTEELMQLLRPHFVS